METITRTAYGSFLQTATLLKQPFTVLDHTTLNEKFEIQATVKPASGEYPHLMYVAIGNGGHNLTIGANNIPKPEPIQHLATDAACFKHIPFVLREPANDLAEAERKRYALRKLETYNSTQYVAYYLRRFNNATTQPEMNIVTIENGVQTSVVPFIPNSSNLNPVPQPLVIPGVNVTDGQYIMISSKIDLSFSESDVDELKNVGNIMYGDEAFGMISEIALVTGVDKAINATNPITGSFTFTECIGSQVSAHVNTFFSPVFANSGFKIIFDAGATEPLFKLSQG